MKVIKHENNQCLLYKTAVALGNFDGIHVGHQHLINIMRRNAIKRKLSSSVLLFTSHTKSVINKKDSSGILTNNNQKIHLLKNMHIDLVYTMDFNQELMHMDCESFAKNILVDKLNAKLVVVGFNYRFGYKALGDALYLSKLGDKFGFEVIITGPVYKKGKIVSSTLVRNLLKNGEINKANCFLGKYYTIQGTVVDGKKRGKKMGFPTANVKLNYDYLIPKFGVYKTITCIDGKDYLSITNVGDNPTFNQGGVNVETHILDFDQKLYGKEISISFIKFIRNETQFNNKDELIGQVMKDINIVKKESIVFTI